MVKDSERFRFLMAHPNYWTDEKIRKEADEIGKRMFKGRDVQEKIVVVTMKGRVVLRGTAKEIAQRSTMNASTIRHYASFEKVDRFGKMYKYENCDEAELEEMSVANV
ncbi:hypothetical protein LIZ91_03000 [Enterococcus avium]|uniref:hypothetical protein n=1 Tax=Enterococcus avium TaxID=33945 RepID=UPI001D0840B9|nr:hypothetical protein [Enterococcus avium]MCB6915545.1 hypothetical protein [Enterococcus avium]MCQ4959578.1 hypothetical protein [Enterococcus avium]